MRMTHRTFYAALLAGLAAVAVACSSSTDPNGGTRPPSGLNIIPLPTGHPALYAAKDSFYAVSGEDHEVRLYFRDNQGNPDEEYVRFRVRPNSLRALPDGTPIQPGDTVKIIITVTQPDSIQFNFEPTGLQFNPSDPARLRIEYGETNDDLNNDGVVDQADTTIEKAAAIWTQHQSGDSYLELQGNEDHDETSDEIEVDVLSFSRFALAY